MDKNQTQLQEQDHPLKNTDHAFVQVGKDGQPVLPNQREAEATHSSEEPAANPTRTETGNP